MAYELQKEGKMKNGRSVSYVDAPFDVSMDLISKAGLQLITARQLANARMHYGKDHSFSTNGSWIKEGDIYIPASMAGKASVVLIPQSLVLENPACAVKAHKDKQDITVTNPDNAMGLLELAKKNKKGYFLLQSRQSIPTARFGEEGLTAWLFGRDAQKYGLFLKESGEDQMHLYFNDEDYINKQATPHINQLWLGRLGYKSNVRGNNHYLKESNRARGVPVSSEDVRAKKQVTMSKPLPAVESYTPNAITKALKKMKLSRLEEEILATLRKSKK